MWADCIRPFAARKTHLRHHRYFAGRVASSPFASGRPSTIVHVRRNRDEVVKSPSMGFLLTESEKCDFHFPYKSMACRTSH